MSYSLLISLILAAVSSLFALTRQLQMLQQNSYFPSRYVNWLKENLPYFDVLLFLVSSLLFAFRLYIAQTIFITAVLALRIPQSLNIQKKSIKKLNFTARIKRMFAAAIILLTALILVYVLNPVTLAGKLCMDIGFAVSFLTPVLALAVWALTYPVERLFNMWYIADAKAKLTSFPDIKVIGITGSYGKTTTKFILTRILSEKFNVVCTPQSYNTPLGVVRTIREQLKPQTQIFVCEMGAKKTGDIKEICDIVNPDFGIITSVGAQHLETFGSIDNVFNTKFELAKAVKAKGGAVFVNGNSKEIIDRINKEDYLLFGTSLDFSFYAKNIVSDRNGSRFDLVLNQETINLSTKLLGEHNIINIAGAAALAYTLGVSANDIKFAVASLKPTEHRLELKGSINNSILIDDAYNANPEGSIAALQVISTFEGMKKVIITPGLIELGEKEYECNYNLGLEAAKKCDIIILVGKNRSKPLADGVNATDFNKDNLFIVSSFKEAMDVYSKFADSNTVVLLENDLPDNYLN